jgi:hypothetical protein
MKPKEVPKGSVAGLSWLPCSFDFDEIPLGKPSIDLQQHIGIRDFEGIRKIQF